MRVLFTVLSASGNTAKVCGLFARRLRERGAECEIKKIRTDAECSISQRACKTAPEKVIML